MRNIILVIVLIFSFGLAQNKRISELNELITTDDTDLMVIVDDLAGTPQTKKITIANLKTAVATDIDAIQFNLTPSEAMAEGKLYWSAGNGTLNLGMPGGSVEIQLGQETVVRVQNKTGVQIDNGSIVQVSGVQGNTPTITLADASSIATSGATGMATENIANNATGYITNFGLVRDVNTLAYSAGTLLWLSETAGEYTSTRPTPPAISTVVGITLTQNETEGVILIQTQLVPRLTGLSDVIISGQSDGDYIYWDNATSVWKARALTVGNVSTSGTPVLNDYARFVNATDVEGRSYSEIKIDLSLDDVSNVATSDETYNATSWNANTDAATKNAIRDKIETLGGATTALDNLASVAINQPLLLGTSDAHALGSATKMWSDLFLASGSVINWNNGDMTLIHGLNILGIEGGNVGIGTATPDSTLHVVGSGHIANIGFTGSTITTTAGNLTIDPNAAANIQFNAGSSICGVFKSSASGSAVYNEIDNTVQVWRFGQDNNEDFVILDKTADPDVTNLKVLNGVKGQLKIGNDIDFDLADDAGVNEFAIRDTNNVNVTTVDSDGNSWFGGNAQVDGSLIVATQTPASAGATGTVGTVTWDANFIYICTATDTWERVAIASW